jgi:peptide-methionine (R)-S-oxide reductase
VTSRREFIGMAGVGVVAIVTVGSYALTRESPKPLPGSFPVTRTDAQWQARLSPAAYKVLREGSTEHPFTSPLLKEHREGVFTCAGCDSRLFESRTKYDSKTGWPSFWAALPGAVIERTDGSLGMSRTEILCKTCGGHLGHVFDDGPKPTGLRYCMNGVALAFVPGRA